MGTKPVTLFPLSPMLHVWLWPRSPGAASAFSHQLGAGQGAWRGADGAPQRSPNQHRAHGLHRWHAGSGGPDRSRRPAAGSVPALGADAPALTLFIQVAFCKADKPFSFLALPEEGVQRGLSQRSELDTVPLLPEPPMGTAGQLHRGLWSPHPEGTSAGQG